MNLRPPESEQQQRSAHRPHASKLREVIDSGRAGDKVRVEDPAAAPLGTDDEAAGTTPTAPEVSLALEHEFDRSPRPARGAKAAIAVAVAGAACVGLLAAAVVWGV